MKMRSLEKHESITVMQGRCPVCHILMPVVTERTESALITTSGHCNICDNDFAVDRSYPAPFLILGGHEYASGDPEPTTRGRRKSSKSKGQD